MTKEMLFDLVKDLKRKNKILVCVLCLFVVLFIGMTIFAFSEFEITVDNETNYEYDIEQEANTNGDNSSISQYNDLSTKEYDNVILICGTICFCILCVVSGVVIYGKCKNKS